MTKTRENKHAFVGMDIKFTGDGRVKVIMKYNLDESIASFGENLGMKANTSTKGDLFKIGIVSKALNEDKLERFHHIVPKLVFVSNRIRIDIEVAISFLYSRVS